MSAHVARVRWKAGEGFRQGRYSRVHELLFDGGTTVAGSASPQAVPPPFSDPVAVDPEEALVASASACHMLWFLSLAQRSGFDVAAYDDDAVGTLGKDERGRIAMVRIVLRPRVDFVGAGPDPKSLAALHARAHDSCFIANSLRSEVVVEAPAD